MTRPPALPRDTSGALPAAVSDRPLRGIIMATTCGRKLAGKLLAPPRQPRGEWEVFSPATGKVMLRTRWRALARVLARKWGADYAPAGWGHC